MPTEFLPLSSLSGGSFLARTPTWLPGYAEPQQVLVPAVEAQVTVFAHGADPAVATPVSVFPNPDGSGTPLTQPLSPDQDGLLPGFVAQPAALDAYVSGPNLVSRMVVVGYDQLFTGVGSVNGMAGAVVLAAADVGAVAPTQPGGGALTATAGRTSTLLAPTLRDFPSLADYPNAAQDGAYATLSFTSGNATATASSVTYTNADIGKVIDVPAAGAAGALLPTTIAGVSAGRPVLAVAPSSSVTNAAAWYGTDNTAVLAAALAAVAALAVPGGGPGGVSASAVLLIPAGRPWVVQSVVPPSFVTVQGYGATLLKHGASSSGIFTNISSRTGLTSRFCVYGLTMIGEYWTSPSTNDRRIAINIYDSTGCKFSDLKLYGFYDWGISMPNVAGCRIKDVDAVDCVPGPGVGNVFHLTYEAVVAWSPISTDNEITGCSVTSKATAGCVTAPICIQCSADNTSVGTYVPFNTRIHHNGRLETTGFSCIALECGRIGAAGSTSQGSSIRNVTIDHNPSLVQKGAAGTFSNLISATDNNGGSGPQSTDPLEFAYLTIDHNEGVSSDGGIAVQSSYLTLDRNTVTLTGGSTSGAAIAWTTNGVNTPIGGAVSSNTLNMPQNGPNGVFVSGITIPTVSDNEVPYQPRSSAGGSGLSVQNCTNPRVRGNRTRYAPLHGSYCTTCTGIEYDNNRMTSPCEINVTNGTTGGSGFVFNNVTRGDATVQQTRNVAQTCRVFSAAKYEDGSTRTLPSGTWGILASGTNQATYLVDAWVTGHANFTWNGFNFYDRVHSDYTGNPVSGSSVSVATGTLIAITNSGTEGAMYSVAGGTVTDLQLKRGSTQVALGKTQGDFLLLPNDQLLVSSSVAPTVIRWGVNISN